MLALIVLFGVVGFGIMVFIHELGHFLTAKSSGIRVEIFSLGWGKKLVGFDYRGTNYRISLFPLGGYCKMKGDDPGQVQAGEEEGAFYAAPAWKRIAVAAAGPLANVLFAVIALSVIWGAGFKIHADGNRIILADSIVLAGSAGPTPARQAGLETGDRIVALDGKPVRSFPDILEALYGTPGREVEVTVRRGAETLRTTLVPQLDRRTGAGRIGIYAWRDPVIDRVAPEGAAARAGLRPGDRILAAGGRPVRNTIDLAEALEGVEGRPARLDIRYQRGASAGSTTLVLDRPAGEAAGAGAAGLGLAFRVEEFSSPRVGFPGALVRGAEETGRTLVNAARGLALLFRGVDLGNAVAGPLRITYYVGAVAASGLEYGLGEGLVSYFRFLSLLSVVLFLMNLLPIPALDGGQILLFLVEIIRGRRPSLALIARIQVISFTLIIFLAVAVTFSDILFFAGR